MILSTWGGMGAERDPLEKQFGAIDVGARSRRSLPGEPSSTTIFGYRSSEQQLLEQEAGKATMRVTQTQEVFPSPLP